MALDQALLENAARSDFPPTLRFYRWSPPAISIGRFQDLADVDRAACSVNGVEIVRRPTGGKCILHEKDFTYSLVLPASFSLPRSVIEAYSIICGGILSALGRIGLAAAIQTRRNEDYRQVQGACFSAVTQADLEWNGLKLCGSAQVRRMGALLQHGSILLEDRSQELFCLLRFPDEEQRKQALETYRSRCASLDQTGLVVSWQELADSLLKGFEERFGVAIEPGVLTAEERRRWSELTVSYASTSWLQNAASGSFPEDAGG
jgi:lipoate-protein ligase A